MPDTPPGRIDRQVRINAPVHRVWRALTDHHEFGAWFGVKLESPFAVGKETSGQITYPGYEHVVMRVVTHAIQPPGYFAFRWHPHAIDPNTDYSNEEPTLVEFRLTPDGNGTILRITESGFEKVPPHRRDQALRMNDGGWAEQLRRIDGYVTSAR